MPKTYRLACFWQMYEYVDVKADSFEEACDKAMQMPLPDEAQYVDDSFEVDEELSQEFEHG